VSTLLCTEHLDESGLDSSTVQVWLSRCDRLSLLPQSRSPWSPHQPGFADRRSLTRLGTNLEMFGWGLLWYMCSGICDRGGCIIRALWHRDVRLQCGQEERGGSEGGRGALHPKESKPQRARCSRQPVPQSECHSTLAARPDSGRMDDVVLCSQIMGKLPWLTDQDSLGPGYWICSLAQVVLPLLGTRCRSNHPNPATASGLAAGETLEFLAHVTIRFSLPFRDTLGGG
jgi:hypothetical protein